MPSGDDDLARARAMAAVAQALAAERDVAGITLAVCGLAAETVDACEHADVMMIGPGGVPTVPAATDWVGVRIVSIEAEFGEGPCMEAVATGRMVDSRDLTTEERWPRFVERCLRETPARSAIGVPLIVGGKTIGALDLYADRVHAFEDVDRAVAALFSAHAALAFEASQERIALAAALATRDLIGQAKGILMAQAPISADEAFDVLRRASQRLNEKLVDVARRVVDEHDAPS